MTNVQSDYNIEVKNCAQVVPFTCYATEDIKLKNYYAVFIEIRITVKANC
jgi:hypothetical protein